MLVAFPIRSREIGAVVIVVSGVKVMLSDVPCRKSATKNCGNPASRLMWESIQSE